MIDGYEVERREVGPLTVAVRYEQFQEGLSPREWDNLTTIVGWDNRYTIGDEEAGRYFGDYGNAWRPWGGYSSLRNYCIAVHDAIAESIVPLTVYDTPVGAKLEPTDDEDRASAVAFVTPEGLATTGFGPPGTPLREGTMQDVETYNTYLAGEVFRYVVTDADGEVVESCTGFLGEPDEAMGEGLAAAACLRPVGQRFVEAGVGL